ncbi:phosphoglycerate kinase [Corynebacterium kroppenstedtii]|uniref:phosphoglycerate kinase n=1 Tax=Corynebacterium sp. PCR 32 TaxID=3351342 RepID=UPI0030A25295
MAVQKLADLLKDGVEGRHVLVRADLNVPLKNKAITDPGRIDASIPTIKTLVDAGARVIVAAHLGRPTSPEDTQFSLGPVAEALSKRLDQYVALASDVSGEDAHERANGLNDGDVLLLENVRFDPREKSKDDDQREELASELAALTGDNGAFVSDGFGVVHRKQASVYDVAKKLPSYVGYLVEKELDQLSKCTDHPEHPYAVCLGGSKVSDKLGVIKALAPKVDTLIIGGGMCYTFLKAKGYGVGNSLLEESMIDECASLLAEYSDKIVLPTDIVVGREFDANTENTTVASDEIEDGWMGLDTGAESTTVFAERLHGCSTIFWNGPVGVFEFEAFSHGTKGLATAIAEATKNGAFSVIGGGDSASAVRNLGFADEAFSHISTGGGASLELIEGKTLPGIAILDR